MKRLVDRCFVIRLVIAVLVAVTVFASQAQAQTEKDPHRPPCKTKTCLRIKSFLKTHYCGDNPGNGPDDGCEIKLLDKPHEGVDVSADYRCEWDQKKYENECVQQKQPAAATRKTLESELQRLGLPTNAEGSIYFRVWKSAHSGWSVGEASYSRTIKSDFYVCEVIMLIDDKSNVLRGIPFQKTNADAPTVTFWTPVDIADVEGNGREEIVLEADAYENHWLEAVRVGNGPSKTIFSGLGYYL